MFSKIKKISHKIVFFNTVTAAILIFSLTLSITLALTVSNIREEIRELKQVSESIFHRTSEMTFDEIVEKYDTLIDENKSEITLYLRQDKREKIFGSLNQEYVDYLNKDSGWNLKKGFTNYYLKFKEGGKEYIFIRYFEVQKSVIQFVVISLIDLLVVALIFVVSSFGARFILTPVSEVIEAAKNINSRNLDARLPVTTDDEIGELAEVLNSTFERIKKAYEIQKRFSQDAAHELKTPISVIKGYTEILEWGKGDPVLLDEAISSIEEEVENIQILLDKLFFLAKIENVKLNYSLVNIRDIFLKLQRDYSITGSNRLFFESGDIQLKCDKNLLLQMLRALIDNALKFSEKEVRLTCFKKWTDTCIEIKDWGIGIDPKQLEKITQRFYTVDEARTRSESGLGLGLSIVMEIVELHGWELLIESEVGQGSVFTIKMLNPII